MSSEAPEATAARRVLVAMDGSIYGLAAVEAAVGLAAQLRAELLGLFVEDADLIRVAAVPVVQELSLSGAAPRPLDPCSLQRTWRAQADQVRRVLAETADRASVIWSLRIERGRVVRASLDSAGESDLVVLGKENSAPQAPAPAAGRRTRAAAQRLLLVYDASPAGQRTLQTATQLARGLSGKVVVVIASSNTTCLERAESAAQQLQRASAATCGPPLVFQCATELVELARRAQSHLVLISRQHPLLDEAVLERLVNELDCPVALVQ
jgi:nucleotide-binding universal stress UspA family protein